MDVVSVQQWVWPAEKVGGASRQHGQQWAGLVLCAGHRWPGVCGTGVLFAVGHPHPGVQNLVPGPP